LNQTVKRIEFGRVSCCRGPCARSLDFHPVTSSLALVCSLFFAMIGCLKPLQIENAMVSAKTSTRGLSYDDKNPVRMEARKLNSSSKFSIPACLAAIFVLLSCSLSLGDVTWIGGVNSDWDSGFNWDNFMGPGEGDYVNISRGPVDFTSGASPRLRGVRQTGGTFNISGGVFEASHLASAFSSFNGEVVQTGGTASINAIEIGGVYYTRCRWSLSLSRSQQKWLGWWYRQHDYFRRIFPDTRRSQGWG